MATQQHPLRIGLDLRPTEQGFKAHAGRGTGRYTNELIRHLLAAQVEEQLPFELVPLHSSEFRTAAWEKQLLGLLPFGKMTFESQFLYPRRVRRADVDMAHFFTHGDASARPQVPQFVTVLDVIPLRFPELYKADKPNWRFRFARYLEYQAIRKASGILAISEATKRDVVQILGVHPDKIFVTPLAVSAQLSDRDATRSEFKVSEAEASDRPFILYVGGIDPRKNVLFLIDVFRELLSDWQGDVRPMLVLAGGIAKDDQYPALCKAIEDAGLERDLHMTGFVSDEALSDLYRSAEAFVFPSLYEGFGLPVLEAMACGCPVLAGDNSCMPEVAGDAALLLPDKDTKAWVHGLRAVLTSDATRAQMSERGLQRARQFSWQRTAEQTIAAYRQFCEILFSRSFTADRQRRHAANS